MPNTKPSTNCSPSGTLQERDDCPVQPPALCIGSVCVKQYHQPQHDLRDIVVSIESTTWTGVGNVRCATDATNEVEAVSDEESQRKAKGHEKHVDGNQRATNLGRCNLAIVDSLDTRLGS